MADKKQVIFEVDVNVESNADEQIEKILQSSDNLRKKFKDLRAAALEASDPVIAQRFAAAAGEIKDQIGDINSAVNNFASDTKKLDVAIGAVQGVAGAFATAQGAAALFGSENKKLDEVLVKVQSSIALLNGVQTIANTLNKESAIGAKLYAASNAILNSSFLAVNGGLKAFRLALIGTGIGAAVVAIGLLIANFDEVKKAIFNLIPGLKDVADFFGKIITAVTDFVGITSEAERALEAKTKATERANEVLEAEIAILEASGASAEQVYQKKKEIVNNELNLLREKLKTQGKLTDEEYKQFRKLKNDLAVLDATETKRLQDEEKKRADDQKKAQEEANKRYQDFLKKQDEIRVANETRRLSLIANENQKELALFDFQREEIRKKAKANGENLTLVDQETAKLRQDIINKQTEEEKKKQDEAQKQALDDRKAFFAADGTLTLEELTKINALEKQLLDKQLAENKISQDAYNAAILTQEQAIIDKKKEIKDTETQKNKEAFDTQLADLDNYYATLQTKQGEAGLTLEQVQAKANAEQAIFKQQLDNNLLSKSEYDLKVAESNAAVDEAENARAEARKKREEDVINSAIGVLGNFAAATALFAGKDEKSRKRAFETNKKIQIAQALIQTYQGANAAFTAASANPITVLFPPYPFIAGGAAVAAGLANVAKIKATKFEGGGGGGGGAAGGAGGGAPNPGAGATTPPVNPFQGQAASSVISPTGRPREQTDQRVFVVESDITKTQNRVRVIETNSNVV